MVVAWTDTTAGVVVKELAPNSGLKILWVRTPATFVNGTDTLAVDLRKFGASILIGVVGFQETTAGSVTTQFGVDATGGLKGLTTAVVQAATTSIATITPLLPANTCISSFLIFCQ
jgi:hypothetical protein